MTQNTILAEHIQTADMKAQLDEGLSSVNSHIRGEDTVDKTITEGTVTFDIRFRAVVPSNGKHISLIINVEAQSRRKIMI